MVQGSSSAPSIALVYQRLPKLEQVDFVQNPLLSREDALLFKRSRPSVNVLFNEARIELPSPEIKSP